MVRGQKKVIGTLFMAIVKGSKQRPIKIVEDKPIQRILVFIVVVAVFIGGLYGSLHYGYQQGATEQEILRDKALKLDDQLHSLKEHTSVLEQQLANMSLGAEVDQRANEEVRQEVIELKAKIASLEEENSFYRGLMAPTKDRRGLTFGVVELSQGDEPRAFNYKVVMQQLASNHQLLKGTLQYKVLGKELGVESSYDLDQLSNQVNSKAIKLRFKYFQTIEGELQLPEGFEPEGIELVARSSGKKPVTIEKRFGWLVEEI